MRRRKFFELFLARWGFAVLVAIAMAVGLAAAITVAPPGDVPSVALRALVVYRVEVGAAVFLGLYLATMAFALALRNRGFVEIGTGGIRAKSLGAVSQKEEQLSSDLIEELFDEIQELRARWEMVHGGR